MKLSELWLREWVNPALSRAELGDRLTMAGLEIEEIIPAAEEFTGVVVAKILTVEKHPTADRLNVCFVDIGKDEPLTIVCGAKNVKVGMKVPAALVGAILPNKTKIKLTELRGVESAGMLCSAMELGLSEQGDGLLPLPFDAPVGENIWDYLKLNDYVMDVAITPNRGDCLSIMGLAKEISALTGASLHIPNICPVKATLDDRLPITVDLFEECPRYVARIIRAVKADAATPMWMKERLRRGGIRSISAVVDVMNYVMLELGQPMHAFDLSKIQNEIVVRKAKPSEELQLLDGQTIKLTADTLLIADQIKPLAIAGVMGGLDSAVTLLTQDILLESAFFNATSIARTGRGYHLNSDSSYRFERGVDPTRQPWAIERATELLLEIVGGQPGPVIEVVSAQHVALSPTIILRRDRIKKVLGFIIPDPEIEKILQRLGFAYQEHSTGWEVTPQPARSDVSGEIDLIEELIRLKGYDNMPQTDLFSGLQIHSRPENKLSLINLRHTLRDLDFNEVVTYSFIDEKLHALFNPDEQSKKLMNPITSEMSVMRTTLWPGLINTLLYNQNRQQARVRIFESGLCFLVKNNKLVQERTLSGLVSGNACPEQWGLKNRDVDFYDLKGDLENLFKLTLAFDEFTFAAGAHPALHPGQTAAILRQGKQIGLLGLLHPRIAQALGIEGKVFVFELELDSLEPARRPYSKDVSRFPEIRRDLAILVDRTVRASNIQDTIKEVAGELLQDIYVFDVYQGKGIAEDRKSVALALTLQHVSRTLRDEEVADIVERVIVALTDRFAAELRG